MTAEEHHISFQRTGRYFTSGDPNKANKLLIALHGYGHLAEYFINKFRSLDNESYFVVCPEGMHRFYLKGTSGRVGASWMTKEDRTKDIADNTILLNSVLEDIYSKFNFDKKILLGFSQGGATATRYMAHGDYAFDKFILWAAVFPPDMEMDCSDKFKHSKNYFVVGDQDEYYSNEKADELKSEFINRSLSFEMINFEGNHNIHDKTLLHILD